MEEGVAVMRPHRQDGTTLVPTHLATLRHSCMEEYLLAHRGQGSSSGDMEAGDLDVAKLNLSKSL
jgi:hypothetical protein